MTTYYVDPTNGLDTNNGLGPDASAGTNKPWKTWGKALGASGIASGDTVYLAPGTYREINTLGLTSPTVQTNILGDPGNAQGFKTSGGVLVTPGPVIWSPYLTTDTAGASTTALITFSGKDFLSFNNIQFISAQANGGIASATTATSTNITFTDCAFMLGGSCNNSLVNMTNAFPTAFNWTFDRCQMIYGSTSAININCAQGTGSDYDVNVIFKNSLFVQTSGNVAAVNVQNTSTGANLGNGAHFINCTIWGRALITTAAVNSTTVPSTMVNSLVMSGGNAALTAGTAGQITENYNIFLSSTANTNVTDGANSSRGNHYAPLFHFGQERIFGLQPRPLGEPMSGASVSGFNNDGTQSSYDGLNRPRPSDGQQTQAGWLGRGNTANQGTSPAPPSGTHTWQDTGPWYQEFTLPVNTTSQTLAIKTQHDANYTGTLPQMQILAQPEIGVSAQTITDTGGSGSWNTLTASAIIPTAVGAITVRILSNDTSGTSVVEFANFTVT